MFLLPKKPEYLEAWDERLRSPDKDSAIEMCGAGTVSGILITIKFGKETALVQLFWPLILCGHLGQFQGILPTPCPRSKGYLSFSAHLTPLVQNHFVYQLRGSRCMSYARCY